MYLRVCRSVDKRPGFTRALVYVRIWQKTQARFGKRTSLYPIPALPVALGNASYVRLNLSPHPLGLTFVFRMGS